MMPSKETRLAGNVALPGSQVSPVTPVQEWRPLADLLRTQRGSIAARWVASQFDPQRLERYAVAGWRELNAESRASGFVLPLLDLLIAYMETGDPVFEQIYLDERLRYAPHQAPPRVRAQFFAEVLPADEDAILALVESEVRRETARAFLAELHAPLRVAPSGKPIRLLAMGDCLMNEVRVFLAGECRRHGLILDFRSLYFGAQQGRGIAVDQVLDFLAREPMDLLAFSFLTYEGIPPYTSLLRSAERLSPGEIEDRATAIVGLMRAFLEQVRETTDAPFLLHNASGLPLGRYRGRLPFLPALSTAQRAVREALNVRIAELAEATPNTILVDEAGLSGERGLRECARSAVPRRLMRRALFHTSRLGAYLAQPYVDVVRSYRELARAKVLLIDFDNTLWAGVMADGPVQHYLGRQRLLRRLKDAGILLVAVSKNDIGNVRWEEMALQADDFVLRKIGWGLKVESIAQAAQELELGLDSFVLLDDNPAERELVRSQLPAVRVLDATDATTWRWVERMLRFPNTRETEEARSRTQLYREQAQRKEAISGGFDYAEMMQSLGLQVRFGAATRADLDRVTELVLRTNQFNTTTRRHDRPTLQRFIESPDYAIYVASLNDRFGQLGLVSVAIIQRTADERVFDSFIMSCRAMGFGLEQLMLGLVLRSEGQERPFVGLFVPSDRNMPAVDLYRQAGFIERAAGEWLLSPEASRPAVPGWFTVTDRNGGLLDPALWAKEPPAAGAELPHAEPDLVA